MKIQNNMPIKGSQARKPGKSRSDGVFHALFDAEVAEVKPTEEQQHSRDDHGGAAQAWRAVEDSVSLLDQAMQCLESGKTPSQEMVADIEQLRSALQQQRGNDTQDLSQAEVMLTVEIERIRALRN
ncbi:MAG: hypothetical protein R8K50_01460 [Mariprofundus sp.]